MRLVNRYFLLLIITGLATGPAAASAHQGEIASQSRASISISVSVAPRFQLRAAGPILTSSGRAPVHSQCLESNLAAGFTVMTEALASPVEHLAAAGELPEMGAQGAGLRWCGGLETAKAVLQFDRMLPNSNGNRPGLSPLMLIIRPE